MRDEVAEAPAEGLLPGLVEVLVAEEHHLVGVQRLPDRRDRPVVQVSREGDAADLRAETAGDAADVEDGGGRVEGLGDGAHRKVSQAGRRRDARIAR